MKKISGLGPSVLYIALFTVPILLFGAMMLNSTSPEQNILGSWKEVAWEYEKVEKDNENGSLTSKSISESIKREIIQSLIIHEAETWEFLPNGKLRLDKKDQITTPLEWNLKGRGHVLKLKHPDDKTEYYNLQKVNDDEMVLYFNSDIKAKGIVKMVFKRVNS